MQDLLGRVVDPLSGRTIPSVDAAVNANVCMQEPASALRPFVQRFVIVEFPVDRKLRLLPSTSFFAEFRFQGESILDGGAKLPRAVISGLRDTATSRCYQKGCAILLIKFTEIGAMHFLRCPLDSFFNTTVPIENAFDCLPELSLLSQKLAKADHHAKRIQIAEKFVLDHVRNSTVDPIVSAAIRQIEERGITVRMDELARRIGLSQSALERRFRRKIGTSPKRFASILRLKNAIRLGGRGLDFTSVAHSAGYTDQSHFINDFKRVTGFSPASFFRKSRICKNAEFLQVAFAKN